MALPQTKQDEIWRVAQENGAEPVVRYLAEKFYPDKQEEIINLMQEDGEDVTLEALLSRAYDDGFFGRSVIEPANIGMGDLRAAEYEATTPSPTVGMGDLRAAEHEPYQMALTPDQMEEIDQMTPQEQAKFIDPYRKQMMVNFIKTTPEREPEPTQLERMGAPSTADIVSQYEIPEGADWEEFWRQQLSAKYYPQAEIDQIINTMKSGQVPILTTAENVPEWESKPTIKDTLSGAKVLALSMKYLPRNAAEKLLTNTQGYRGASAVDKHWARPLLDLLGDPDKFAKQVAQKYKNKQMWVGPWGVKIADVANFSDQIAYSGLTMGGATLAAAGGTAVGGPGVGAAAAAGAAGAIAFQLSSYEVMQNYLELKDEEQRATLGRGLTKQEENRLKREFEGKAIKYGLWEAIPEMAVGGLWSAKFMKALTATTGSQTAARGILSRMGRGAVSFGAMTAEEQFTETITEKGQRHVLAGTELGTTGKVDWTDFSDWVDSFHTVAPQTLMLTAVLGGAGKGLAMGAGKINSLTNRAKKMAVEEVGEKDPYLKPILDKIDKAAKRDKQTVKDLTDAVDRDPTILEGGEPTMPPEETGTDMIPMSEIPMEQEAPTPEQPLQPVEPEMMPMEEVPVTEEPPAQPIQVPEEMQVETKESAEAQNPPEPTEVPAKPVVTEPKMPQRIQSAYREETAKLPPRLRQRVNISNVREGTFGGTYEGTGGRYDPKTRTVYLENEWWRSDPDTLLHEVVHQIVNDMGPDDLPFIRDFIRARFKYGNADKFIEQAEQKASYGGNPAIWDYYSQENVVDAIANYIKYPNKRQHEILQTVEKHYVNPKEEMQAEPVAPEGMTQPEQTTEVPVIDKVLWNDTVAEQALSEKYSDHLTIANQVYNDLVNVNKDKYEFMGDISLIEHGKSHIAYPGTMQAEILINPKQVEREAKKLSNARNISIEQALRMEYADLLAHEIAHNKSGIEVEKDELDRVIKVRHHEKEAIQAGREAVEKIAPPILPETDQSTEQWVNEKLAEHKAKQEEEGQKGFINFKREEKPPLPDDPKINEAINAWKDTSNNLMSKTGGALVNSMKVMKDFAMVERDANLRREGFIQFNDDIRTGYIPILPRAEHEWTKAKKAIFGELSRRERESLFHLLALRNINENQARGLTEYGPEGEELPEAFDTLKRFEERLQEKSPQVLEAAQRYRDYVFNVAQDLVDRKVIPPEAVRSEYFPEFALEHSPDWWHFAPIAKKIAEEPFRRYKLQRRGGGKRIAYNEDALDVHFTSVLADNMMEDWSLDQLNTYDISGTLTPEEKREVYGVNKETDKTLRPVHRGEYKYDGKEYLGIRYEKGAARWGYEANIDLLEQALEDAALDVDRLLTKGKDLDINRLMNEGAVEKIDQVVSRSPEEQQKMLRSYLFDVGPRGGNAIRRALIMGRNVKVYVVPKPIGEKLLNLHSPLGMRWMRPFLRMTNIWKGFTLGPFVASVPFMIRQVEGDGQTTYRNNAMALLPQNWMSAIKIIANADPDIPSWVAKIPGFRKLSPLQEEARRIAQKKDVFGASFFQEYNYFNKYIERMVKNVPAADLLSYLFTMWGRSNAFREAILRISTVYTNVKRVNDGLPVWMPEYTHIQPGLDTDSQIGYLGRNVNSDYLDNPEYYNRFFRGFAFPFATFYQKSGANWARYMYRQPERFTAKFLMPYVAVDYHNEKRFPKVTKLLPNWIRNNFYFVINSWDDDNDGYPDRARVFAPQMPLDMAIQLTGLDSLRPKLILMLTIGSDGKPVMSGKEVAKEQIKDMWEGKWDAPTQLASPLWQAIDGIRQNRDSFTKRKIIPDESLGLPYAVKWRDYYAPYVMEKMITPIGQYMRATRGDEKIFGAMPTSLEDVRTGLDRYTKQTFNPMRGFGIYEINLHKQFANQLMKVKIEAEAKAKSVSARIVEDYIATDMTPDEYIASDRFKKKVENARTDNIPLVSGDYPTPESFIYNKITNYDVVLEKTWRMKQLATTDEEKRKLEKESNAALYYKFLESASKIDRNAWPEWMIRLEKDFKEHPWNKPADESR